MMISNCNYDVDLRFRAQTLTCSRPGPEAAIYGDRFVVTAKGNPRTLGFAGGATSKPVPFERSRKPSVPIVNRFKSMLKRRADDLRVLSGGDVPPPTTKEIVGLYVTLLSELILNSKPIISDLTIIAGDHKEHAVGIADAICARIMEVPFDQKLPSLYLLDSIVKNIGQDYIRHFSSRLLEVFCDAYRKALPSSYRAMQHLFGTWSAVFPPSVLQKIEAQLQFSPAVYSQSSGTTSLRASESPRLSHGVHVNPKCLEEKHMFDPSPVDNNMQHVQGTSSTAKVSGQKSAIGYDECSSGHVEVISSQATDQRLDSTSSVDHGPFALGTDKVLPSSTARVVKPASPTTGAAGTSSPPAEKLLRVHSPKRAVEIASPSHCEFEHGLVRSVGKDEETNDSQRKPWSNDMSESSAAGDLIDEYKRQGLRALIDEYGSDRGQRLGNDKSPKFGHFDMNGAGNKVLKKAWQDTEEEEYDWEDMNPTSANFRQSNNVLPSSIPLFGSFTTRPCSGPLESDLNSSKWSTPTKTISPHTSNLPDVDVQLRRFPTGASRMGSTNVNSLSMNVQSDAAPMSSGMWPCRNVPNTHVLPLISNLPQSKEPGYQFNLMNSCTMVANQDPNKSLFLPELNSKLPQMPSHLTGSIPSNRPNQTVVPPLNPRCNPEGHTAATSAILENPVPAVHSSTPTYNIANNNVHFQWRALPPLAPVPPPNNEPGNALSGVISSLIAQGLITLPKQPTIQDSVGVDFKGAVLNTRSESAISALYGDMSRQCATCGLRFKCQEEHRNHMDWHVIRNRVSKNCKARKRSRGWFASSSMWLASANASGTEPVPGFLLSKSDVEKKDDEEPDVPADEEQTVCALCGEHFDDYYSDEADEWMYRGAVYLMNAPVGSITGMVVDRAQLGPIVHAKCRSEPKGNMEEEEGGRRKRMRLS